MQTWLHGVHACRWTLDVDTERGQKELPVDGWLVCDFTVFVHSGKGLRVRTANHLQGLTPILTPFMDAMHATPKASNKNMPATQATFRQNSNKKA